jgi:F1F0 ATPase subunit 2
MTETLALLYSLMVGVGIGLIFFGGLWWTLNRDLRSWQPVWGFALSFGVRTGLALMGFYWLVLHQWQHLLSSLLGFFLVRLLFIYGQPLSEMYVKRLSYEPKP